MYRSWIVMIMAGIAGLVLPFLSLKGGDPQAAGSQYGWSPGEANTRPIELINMGPLRAGDTRRRVTAEYGPKETPEMHLTLRSLDREEGPDATVKLHWTVHDHPNNGKKVIDKTVDVTVPAGGKKTVKQKLRLKKPGPYWVRVAIVSGGKKLKKDRLGIIYDGDNYKPPLTRPEDFEEFWEHQLAEMRKVPFEAEKEKIEAYGTDTHIGYNLDINGHDGERLKCVLLVPREKGPYDAELGAGPRGKPERIKAKLAKAADQPAGVGMWERGATRLHVGAPSPRKAEFTYWNGRDDNNMLHCYLQTVRLTDYLRSRDDVRHIWLFGASRGGPIMLAAAALAPEQVAAVNVHVPTSCGISWKDRPYRGWGHPPSRTEKGLRTAAYFDPVNFAPDLKVPVVMDGGFYDGLAPIPGMLAFCNHATDSPFRRWSIEQGSHGYFKVSGRGKMEAALARYLAKQGIIPGKGSGND